MCVCIRPCHALLHGAASYWLRLPVAHLVHCVARVSNYCSTHSQSPPPDCLGHLVSFSMRQCVLPEQLPLARGRAGASCPDRGPQPQAASSRSRQRAGPPGALPVRRLDTPDARRMSPLRSILSQQYSYHHNRAPLVSFKGSPTAHNCVACHRPGCAPPVASITWYKQLGTQLKA